MVYGSNGFISFIINAIGLKNWNWFRGYQLSARVRFGLHFTVNSCVTFEKD